MTNTLPTALTVPCYTQAGPLQIWVSTGSANAMELLGWTRGGIQITEQAFQVPLTSDVSGGPEGPPDDYQYLGEMHQIVAELARYDTAILAKLARRINAGVATRTKGMLVACSTGYFRALFLSTNFVRNYTRIFIPEPIDMAPIGTPVMYPRISFTGLEDSANTDSKPWNTTYTAGSGTIT